MASQNFDRPLASIGLPGGKVIVVTPSSQNVRRSQVFDAVRAFRTDPTIDWLLSDHANLHGKAAG